MKVAVITGTSRGTGIGRTIATTFLNEGYKVFGVDIMKEDISIDSTDYRHHLADLSEPTSINTVYPAFKQAFNCDHIDVLINNAGLPAAQMPETPEDRIKRWYTVIHANLTSAFLLSEVCLPHMKSGSSIVHISSVHAKQSDTDGNEAYASSKSGLLGLTHAQAVYLTGRNIRVNAVLPGWIEPSSSRGADVKDHPAHAWHPIGRLGDNQDIANMCLFLADSSKAGFITGQEFVVDGGALNKMCYPY